MSKHLWKPVAPAVIEAAWQAQCRGLSLRAIAAELAAKGMLSPSDRPYLPGSIANMLRDRTYRQSVVDAAAPADLEQLVDGDIEVEIDDDLLEQPAALEPAVDAAPPVDAVPTPIVVVTQPIVDTAAPIVDTAPVKPRWEPKRTGGLVDYRDLLRRLGEVPASVAAAALASVNLRVDADSIGKLVDRSDWRDTVASRLTVNT